MIEPVGFDEMCWLQALAHRVPKQGMPLHIGAKLLQRGLVERKMEMLVLTPRGRIALAKLG